MVRDRPVFIARSRERGAALFVVVLVIVLLMGIGAFAARSAHLATAASGSERQMTQARYVAEYGLMFASAKLSNGGAQAYLSAMRNPQPTELCYGQQNTPAFQGRSCYRMMKYELQLELGAQGFNVCDAAAGGQPGSLGFENAECDFVVELSDIGEGFTMPGDSSNGKLKFWYVTASSTGQVRRPVAVAGGAALDPSSAESSATQTVRSRLLVGPFPGN